MHMCYLVLDTLTATAGEVLPPTWNPDRILRLPSCTPVPQDAIRGN